MPDIHFANIWWLLLILPLIFAYFWQKRSKIALPNLTLPTLEGVKDAVAGKAAWLWLPDILRLFAIAFLVIAMARPQQTLQEEQIKGEGIDIFLAIDLSSSMLAKDFKPDRLEVCKQVAASFVEKRPIDRIGLVVFSGEAYAQCPLTTDHTVVQTLLGALTCGTLEDGTAIGMGLATAVNRIKDGGAKSKIVILLTDGVNNAGYVKPIAAADLAKELGIKVYTIGVGTTGEAYTPVGRRGDGEYVFGFAPVEIDEALMNDIAQRTGGKYFRATNADELEQIYNEINQLEKTVMDITVFKRYKDLFAYPLVWGLMCLLLELGLRNTILRTLP
jgi:Ca-activated chloride channel homolog